MMSRARKNPPDGLAHLVHEDVARYDPWVVAVLGGTLALTLVLGLLSFRVAPLAGWLLIAFTVFDALLFHAVCPRRYQIFTDRLRIVLGRPFAFNIPIDTIAAARPGPGRLALAYSGFRFSPSTKTVVEIVRRGHWNVVISPGDRERFLEQLAQAIKAVPCAF